MHHLLLLCHICSKVRINLSPSEWLLPYFMTSLCTVKADTMARTKYPEDGTHKEEICVIEYVEIKCQLDATEVFIADLIARSTCFGHHYAHHQELKSIIQWLLPVVFRAVVFKLLVWCGAEGYVSG